MERRDPLFIWEWCERNTISKNYAVVHQRCYVDDDPSFFILEEFDNKEDAVAYYRKHYGEGNSWCSLHVVEQLTADEKKKQLENEIQKCHDEISRLKKAIKEIESKIESIKDDDMFCHDIEVDAIDYDELDVDVDYDYI